MKKILFPMFLIVFIIGCSSASDQNITELNHSSKKEILSDNRTEMIVAFKKGVSIDTAKKEIEAESMSVVNILKTLSESTKSPMMVISSPYPTHKTIKILKVNSKIKSISQNREIKLEPDPAKPQ